jgi:IBR domain, a half RING-finger domain
LGQLVNYDPDPEDDPDETGNTDETSDKLKDSHLSICEDCGDAFCRTCLRGWHGDYILYLLRIQTEDEKRS